MEFVPLKYLVNKEERLLLEQIDDIDYLKIEWKIASFSHVSYNEILGEVIYTRREIKKRLFTSYEESNTYRFNILSPQEGILYIDDERLLYNKVSNNSNNIYWESDNPKYYKKELQKIAFVFWVIDDLYFYYFNTDKAVLEADPYTNLHKIHWDKHRGIFSEYGEFRLEYINDNAVLVFYSDEKLRKGDCISLRFENNQILDYLIQNEPMKTDPLEGVFTYMYYFTLYKEDLQLLIDCPLDSYRITYLYNRLPAQTNPNESLLLIGDDAAGEISSYANYFLNALERLVPNYELPQRKINSSADVYEFNWCYVYLMKDVSNGYYKIGISNTPEYREKTLQSEKPTIELLACKQFPTRKIAKSIESALHTTYGQQRLRGEWFNLNDEDVAAIIETLK